MTYRTYEANRKDMPFFMKYADESVLYNDTREQTKIYKFGIYEF